MPSVLSLKEIRTSKDLKEEIRKLQEQIEDLHKQMAYQKKVEAKLREDLVDQKKDYDHLEKQFEHFAGLEADYEELQSQLQLERLEKLIGSDKVEVKSNAEMDKAKEDLKKIQAELKELKALDPQRLKRQVADLKKKSPTQATENQTVNKALVTARKELREMTGEKEKLEAELEAGNKGTDFFWQSQDEVWQLYETSLLLKNDDPKDKDLPNKVKCLNTITGMSAISREMDAKELAVWLSEIDVPSDVSKEAGKRHKKIASDSDEEE
jgi:DNA repair exonuclease SbcCD ATPase subunit